jgi:alpha-ketoglutarate-dependent taurine dioxygenase
MQGCIEKKLNQPFGLTITPAFSGQSLSRLSIDELRELARQHHLVILRDFSHDLHTPTALVHYARQWGEIQSGSYGDILEVREHRDAQDHVFDHHDMHLHWDGVFVPTVPEFQLFHCLQAPRPEAGGQTTFVNTRALIRQVSAQRLAQWQAIEVTYRIDKVAHYGGEVRSPLLVHDPRDHEWVLRYCEPPVTNRQVLNRHSLEYHGIEASEISEFALDLHRRLCDPQFVYAHAWQPGDLLIADNFSLLHGRRAFTSQCTRHLQRVHLHGSPRCINRALIHAG